jgi:hypothetical protein
VSSLDVHIVHDADGRILALAPADPISVDGGPARGLTPVPAEGQFALRLTLTEEHTVAGPVALIRQFEVDLTTGRPGLRRRTS